MNMTKCEITEKQELGLLLLPEVISVAIVFQNEFFKSKLNEFYTKQVTVTLILSIILFLFYYLS